MEQDIQNLRGELLAAIEGAADADALEAVRVEFLSRNGRMPALLEKMKDIPKEQRPIIGRVANELKTAVASAYETRKASLEQKAAESFLDPTLPGRPWPEGSLHPIRQVEDLAIAVFQRLGFALADGPDVESEYYNFDALNTPQDHPARNEQDTFYLKDGAAKRTANGFNPGRLLLRTQTSPVQIRTMEAQRPPIRIIAPGRCYRRDEIDATHGMSFHQMEGLVVAEKVTLAELKGTLEFFFRELLGKDLKFRFRPHFFPFTEPSFEVDFMRPGSTVRGKEWLEICGCGMVHPRVLEMAKIDPEKFTGFAFGFGVERIAMMLHEIPDLRLFTENDVRFLRQFSRAA